MGPKQYIGALGGPLPGEGGTFGVLAEQIGAKIPQGGIPDKGGEQ